MLAGREAGTRDVSNAVLLPCVTSPEGFLAQVALFVNVFGAGEVATRSCYWGNKNTIAEP